MRSPIPSLVGWRCVRTTVACFLVALLCGVVIAPADATRKAGAVTTPAASTKKAGAVTTPAPTKPGGAVTTPGDNAKDAAASLRGLPGVHVAIAAVSPELEARGITTDVILAEVVLQLRQAAIPFLDELPKPPPDGPQLHVEVLANVDPNFDQCSFGFRLELRQSARLEHDPKRGPLRVVTWSTGGIGEAGAQWRQILREELAYYVGLFVTAYRDANPL